MSCIWLAKYYFRVYIASLNSYHWSFDKPWHQYYYFATEIVSWICSKFQHWLKWFSLSTHRELYPLDQGRVRISHPYLQLQTSLKVHGLSSMIMLGQVLWLAPCANLTDVMSVSSRTFPATCLSSMPQNNGIFLHVGCNSF